MAAEQSDQTRIGAVILVPEPDIAEGHDNEEVPPFVPMLPLDGTTVIKREIHTLRKAGISVVMVFCSNSRKKQLKNHLSHHGVIFLEGDLPDAKSETEDSMRRQALRLAAQYCDRVLLIPVDCPAFPAETVLRLAEAKAAAVASCDGIPSRFLAISCSDFPDEKGSETLYWNANKNTGSSGNETSEGSTAECAGKWEEIQKIETGDQGILLSVTEHGLAKTEQYVRTLRNANPLRIKTKLVIGKEHDFFGPGLYHLLCRVQETGSIQAAASDLGMSYSKCWKLLNRAEEEMGFPFLVRYNGGKHGGFSQVTPEGMMFLERYHAMDEDLKRISHHFFDVYFKDFQ